MACGVRWSLALAAIRLPHRRAGRSSHAAEVQQIIVRGSGRLKPDWLDTRAGKAMCKECNQCVS